MDNALSSPLSSSQASQSERAPGARKGASKQHGRASTVELNRTGLTIKRRFTTAGRHPFDDVIWDLRTAAITNEKGDVVFEQENCEIPQEWSQMATNVVVSKYFRGQIGTPQRESSVKQLIGRVVETITEWGRNGGYFASDEDALAFRDELTYLVLHQLMAFNSPVWFNLGVEGSKPQASACFINSVEDTMEAILTLAKTEGMLFKYGSGTGSNLSSLRASNEPLGGGGVASGPVSFMKGFDAFAGVIKSGGTTRRAAKMVILNVDHPDIEEFITCKVREEKKAWALIDAGYDGSFTGEAYGSVFFQNSNNSVRVTDAFMEACEKDTDWDLRYVQNNRSVAKVVRARDLLHSMAEAAYFCGDPGIQYDTIINDWHTSPESGRINASNPCSEYMFLDDSACNLASLNLLKFLGADGSFDVDSYRHAVDVTITAQEIIVGNASYPTERIGMNSVKFRPLGLGYANLGALLMARGLPYDSDPGREYAAALTSIMTGEAYAQSARIAREVGPFEGYAPNRDAMLGVMRKHQAAATALTNATTDRDLVASAQGVWDDAVSLGESFGYRNAQATVLAPTGTIGFLMDCDTTGVEPDIALVKYKKLVGGGMLKIVNRTVPLALHNLGYASETVNEIIGYIDAHDTIEGSPDLRADHLPVFDCAFTPAEGGRSIRWRGHVLMMAAVQPFISGAISKTVNMPEDTTVEEVEAAYIDGWKLGLKALAIYRDGSKRSQPMGTTMAKTTGEQKPEVQIQIVERPLRRRLSAERQAVTHRFEVGGQEGYITVGLYEDGTPGEIFLRMAKEGSTVSGLIDAFATVVSMALQYGVPLEALIKKFAHMRFEPQGYTKNPEIPIAKSILDYVFRWLASRFLPERQREDLGIHVIHPDAVAPEVVTMLSADPEELTAQLQLTFRNQEDAPACTECGSIMVRSGACYKCYNCGGTSGCS